MIPQGFVDQVLARVDIVDLIERYVPLKKGGANYLACCPFHNEKSPSFTVSPSKQFYHCFGCGAHGTAVGFLMEYAGLSFRDAIKELAGQVGLQVPEEETSTPEQRAHSQSLTDIMATASRYFREQLKRNPRAIDYLKRRGLTGEVAARFGIGYAPDDWQNLRAAFPRDYDSAGLLETGMVIQNETGRRYDRFRDRIMFPILDQRGNVVGFGGRVLDKGEPKYLNSPETPLFEKGRELYGLFHARQAIRESGMVLVTEGYMDVVALSQFGFHAAVAALGTATTPTHVQKLFRQAERVVFCFDGDNAGRKAARRALEACLEQLADDKVVRFLFLPPEHDPDSYVRERGLEAFRRALDEATPLTEFLLRELRSGLNLDLAEDRARLIHEAKSLVPRIAAPVLQTQMLRMLAEQAGMEAGEVARALGLRHGGKPQKAPPARAPRAGVVPPTRQMLRLLALHPELCGRLPGETVLALKDEGERDALQALLDAYDDGALGPSTLAAMYERFRDAAAGPVIADMMASASEDHLQPESVENVLTDLLLKLKLQALDDELVALQRSITGGRPSPEQTQRLSVLLAEKQKLKTGQNH